MSWFKRLLGETGESEADRWLRRALEIYQKASSGQIEMHELEQGIQLCRKAESVYQSLDKSGIEAECYNLEGSLHRFRHDLQAAIECHEKALKIIHHISPESESEGRCLNNLAELHRESYLPEPLADDHSIEHFIKALRYAVQACTIFQRKHPKSKLFALALYHSGRICAEFGEVETAERILSRARRLFASVGDSILKHHCDMSLNSLKACDVEMARKHRKLAEYLLKGRNDWEGVQHLLDTMRMIARER
ncbi:hypothetical protein KAU11_05855 [Candidatus Babeliales bacterium]|nr:hypothetical protein [Candidatus Babeliales bacterium]